VSDFKYAAINAALLSKIQDRKPDEFTQLAKDCVSGVVPVVDGASAWRLRLEASDKWEKASNAFAEALEARVMKWPLERMVLFLDIGTGGLEADQRNRISHCAYVILVKSKDSNCTYQSEFCAMMSASGKVSVMPVSDPEIAQKSSAEMGGLIRCLSLWMATKNSETEDALAPRASRRRHEAIQSVRFRRVFIRPLKKTAQRYEVTGENCPLHHVRGHLRHVSEVRPLFGRKGNHGTFWISEHWRGDEDNGRIVQEYVVNQPDA
jgi:hypothetical protein